LEADPVRESGFFGGGPGQRELVTADRDAGDAGLVVAGDLECGTARAAADVEKTVRGVRASRWATSLVSRSAASAIGAQSCSSSQ
jgi:hypothetical protein